MDSPWFIIADDFTGSGDSAVQFRTSGHPARLMLGPYQPTAGDDTSAAIVIDSDSRYLQGTEAYAPVRAITESLVAMGASKLFKKIDSTLRGNIADEIAAVMDGARFELALVCPAAPRNGRTVIDGICLVDGRPVSSGATGRDLFTPVAEAAVASHFEGRFSGRISHLPLSAVRAGTASLKELVLARARSGSTLFVADAETREDLCTLAMLSSIPQLLLAGSSGLAEALACRRPTDAGPDSRVEVAAVRREDALFVVGSLTPTSAAQCDRLASAGSAEVVAIDSGAALSEPDREIGRILAAARERSAGKALLLRTDSVVPRSSASSMKERASRISAFFGRAVRAVVVEEEMQFLFASGGDTAARLARALGANYIDFTEELLPGVPYGRFRSESLGRSINFACKSGGFGSPEALIDVLSLVAPEAREKREEDRR